MEITKVKIENMIYEIRGKQVMLDSDLAILYNVETKRINEAVKRNQDKFPKRFAWVLTDEESKNFLVAFCGQKKETRGGKYKNPRVFTEQGVAMLATVLKSSVATQVSIAIMDAFVSMRHYLSNNLIISNNIEHKLLEHDTRISLLEETFQNFKKKNNHIFFEGQIYDAYSLLIDILTTATKNIIIIDNYIDKKILDVCAKINANILFITKNIDKMDLEKFNKQYNNVEINLSSSFHDRFIIIDEKTLYHCGASFKDLGKKCFAINKIEDFSLLNKILKQLMSKK